MSTGYSGDSGGIFYAIISRKSTQKNGKNRKDASQNASQKIGAKAV
jgi:hypothetical protein